MKHPIMLCAAAALVLAGTSAAQAQYSGPAPSQQEIAGKLRGLPTLGGAPVAPANPVYNPASLSTGREPPRVQQRTRSPHPHPAAAAPAAAPARENPSIAFRTITFQFNSAELTPQSVETLKNLGNALNQDLSDIKSFVIEGHTDKTGTEAYNEELSQRRAAAVREYLVGTMGVAPERLQSAGVGFSKPANPGNPYAAENRRVVVINAGAS